MALFVLDIVVLNAYVVTMLIAGACYVRSKERLFLYEALLVFCFALDHFLIFSGQFLFNSFPSYDMESTSITAPEVKIIVLVVRQVAYLLIARELFGLRYPKATYIAFPLLFMLYWNLHAQVVASTTSAIPPALFYSVMQVYLLVLVAACYGRTRLEEHARHRRLLLVTLVFIVAIVAFDCTWVFGLYNPFNALFGTAYESNLSETLLHLFYCALIVREAFGRIEIRERVPERLAVGFDEEAVTAAVRELNLTRREEEVFRLLLEDCSYQEICDRLVVSLSTVKSHVHNIYDKAGCSRRGDLRRLVSTKGDK